MRLFIVAVDEPIYLVPYLRGVMERCEATVVGVAVLRRRARWNWKRMLTTALLAAAIFSVRQWLQLLAWKAADLAAATGWGRTRHHLEDVCRDLGVACRVIESVNAEAFVAGIQRDRIDVLLNQTAEFLRQPILRAPAIAVINRHMSLLPAYRGAWPLFWQFVNGDRQLGVTVHVVDEGIDTGPIVAQEGIERLPGETLPGALTRLFDRSVALTCVALARLRDRSPLQPNDGPTASHHAMPAPAEVLRYLVRLPRRPEAS